jgi:tetratricopeptide (TPR) repeat protein
MFVSQELQGSGFSEGSTVTDIVRLSVKTGNIEEPLAMIPFLKHGSDKIACLSIIAATVAKQRRFKKLDELVEIAESLESTIRIPTTGEVRIVSLRQGALHAIAVAIAVEGTLTRALNVASTIEDDYYKIEALTEISKALIAAGDNKLALASLQQGPQIVKEMPAGGGIDKKQSRFTLSLALCNAGGVDQALLLAEEMRAPTDKSRVLTAIARSLFESGDRQQSLTLLTQSSKLAKQVNHDLFKSMVVPDIAFLFADHGDFSQALASAAQLDDPSTRFEILSRKATALAAMGELEEALKAARAIPEPGNAVGQIAVALAGKEEFTKALGLANTIENKYEKASALVDIASALIVAEQFEQALSALDRLAASNLSTFRETWYLISSLAESGQLKLAHEIASRTNVDHQKVLALLVIAVGQAQTPDNEQALQTLQQALDTANKLEDSHNTSASVGNRYVLPSSSLSFLQNATASSQLTNVAG